MGKGKEFVTQLETTMEKSLGQIVGKGLLKNQITKLNKDIDALTAEDCKILIQNIVKSISLFTTKEEAGTVQSELDRLFKTHFSQ